MLSDRDQIANLLARYCFTIDDGDVEGWKALFAPDAVVRLHDTVIEGIDTIAVSLAGAFGAGRHANLSCAIDVADDGTASAVTDFLYAWRDDAGRYSLQTTPGPHFGRYQDQFVQRDGAWRFVERAITVFSTLA